MSYGFGIRREHELAEQLAHMLGKIKSPISVLKLENGGAQVRILSNNTTIKLVIYVKDDLTFEILNVETTKVKKLKQINAVVRNVLKLEGIHN